MTNLISYDSPIIYDSNRPYDIYVPTNAGTPPVQVTHLRVPAAIRPTGSFNANIQGTVTEITQSVEVICGSVVGERTVVPSFGMPLQDFLPPSPTDYVEAVNNWDTRAAVTVTVGVSDVGVSNVSVKVSLNQGSAV